MNLYTNIIYSVLTIYEASALLLTKNLIAPLLYKFC